VSADIKDGPQYVQLLESDFQFPGVGNPGLLRYDRSGEKQRQAENRRDILLDNLPSLLPRAAPG
jgi:hypothetical protein